MHRPRAAGMELQVILRSRPPPGAGWQPIGQPSSPATSGATLWRRTHAKQEEDDDIKKNSF
eukprot:11050627-Alexandrium_andersonii.AAC.1